MVINAEIVLKASRKHIKFTISYLGNTNVDRQSTFLYTFIKHIVRMYVPNPFMEALRRCEFNDS